MNRVHPINVYRLPLKLYIHQLFINEILSGSTRSTHKNMKKGYLLDEWKKKSPS